MSASRIAARGEALYTVEEVAERIGRNPQLVRRWIRDGRLEAITLGSVYAIPAGALRRFVPPAARPRRVAS